MTRHHLLPDEPLHLPWTNNVQPHRPPARLEGKREAKEGATLALGDDRLYRPGNPGVAIRKLESVAVWQLGHWALIPAR